MPQPNIPIELTEFVPENVFSFQGPRTWQLKAGNAFDGSVEIRSVLFFG
jgi:hypothetical protein